MLVAEQLINAEEVSGALQVGELLDLTWMRARDRPRSVEQTLAVMTDDDKALPNC